MDRSTLEAKPVGDLREIAGSLQLTGYGRLRKADLIDRIMGEVGGDSPASQPEILSEDADASDEKVVEAPTSAPAAADAGRQARDEVIERRRRRNRGEVVDEPADDSGTDASDSSDDDDSADEPARPRQRARGGAPVRDRNNDSSSRQSSDSDGNDQSDDDDDDDRNRGRGRNRRNRGGQGGQAGHGDLETRTGVLDLLPEGYGFLRTTGYVAGTQDVYVSQSYVRRFNLRRGDLLGGPVRFNKGNDKFPALARLETCEGEVIDNEHDPLLRDRPDFDELTPVFPGERLLDIDANTPTAVRVLDLVAPVGRGQRGLIVAPPQAGTTTLLRQLAGAVEATSDELHLMVVLVDERPEEVTEYERSCSGEVIASTFDRAPEDHTSVAELAIERAKRLVERGHDVVVLLDSLTALSRAYGVAAGHPAPTPGAIDPATLHAAKRFFGAARNLEDAGSLTVLAAVRTGTESVADAIVLEEFSGTSNLTVQLLPADPQRPVPTVDVTASATRRPERLLSDDELAGMRGLAAAVASMESAEAAELVVGRVTAAKDVASVYAGFIG